jgi:Protein of unknown function (DUF1670)
MSRTPDGTRTRYGPLLQKTLKNAISHVMGRQFPRIGGPRIRALCADIILDVVAAHVRPTEHMKHGQVLWLGIAVDDPPRRGRCTADTTLVPVVLDLSTSDDITARLERVPAFDRLQTKAIRLCEQAHRQGALLSNCDLSELLGQADGRIAEVLTSHERKTGQLVPRRATLHDVGAGLTHKRIICLKRYAEGKAADVIAKETYHGLDAVDRYLGQFDRVRACRREGMSAEKTAFTLGCSLSLVHEYLKIDRELEGKHD